jgi:hypothetical protein
MRCSVILASFLCSLPVDVPEDEKSSPRDGYQHGRLGSRDYAGLAPRYCAAVSTSCGSRTVAMSFWVAVGLIS